MNSLSIAKRGGRTFARTLLRNVRDAYDFRSIERYPSNVRHSEANDACAWSNIRRMKPRGQVLKKCSRGSEHGSWMARGALSKSWFRDVCLSEFICEV
ncbi:MAG: hypothetical protein ACTS6H_02615 [Candidatus Hodgkinia cicadicola]